MANRVYESAKGKKVLYDDLLKPIKTYVKAQPKSEIVRQAQETIKELRMSGFIPPQAEEIPPESFLTVQVKEEVAPLPRKKLEVKINEPEEG